ncbi:MAG: mercury(II) reductase [Deltaproteobacteria bacterium]|nr:mercury(II) reductase [Deltaproteobacteria bacterium]
MDSKHLIILGGGSAAFAAAIRGVELGARVTLINDILPIGGTCVNVGCVPSKTLIRAAEAHHRAFSHNFDGIQSKSRIVDFKAIIGQKQSLVKELRQAKYLDVISNLSGVRLIKGMGTLVDSKTVAVDGNQINGDAIIIATGASPVIPNVAGISTSGYLTNETLFELDTLPESMIIVGGGYIALESAQIFSRFGSKVTILEQLPRIMARENADLTEALALYLENEGLKIHTNVEIREIIKTDHQVAVKTQTNGQLKTFNASHILIAAGRKANTGNIGLDVPGIETDENGFLKVDDSLRTSVPNIYGAGDVIGGPMFVYTAAYEGNLAAENAILEKMNTTNYDVLPWVVFTDPQLAGVGMDEQQAAAKGYDAEVSTLPLSSVPRSLAARDTRGFIKLIRDKKTDKLLGARILAPEGSELLMEVSMAIKSGITAQELASSFHPYLTLSEGVKLAALSFKKDVNKLSCCAS